MQLIVHGGAGSDPDEPAERRADLQEAARAGAAEPTPLDAVVTAVAVLEAAPRFNAGLGGAVQADGAVRTDAAVMTGDRAVGAVCAVPGVVHATAVARVVLESTPHVLVSGDQAAELATHAGIETGQELRTDDTRRRFADAEPPDGDLQETLDWVNERFGASDEPTGDHDTVGAVAVAEDGPLAAATSTGGRWFAFPGRVGDTPQVGAGFYAAAAGGACATGWGEDIARVTLTREAIRRLEAGNDVQTAAEDVIAMFEAETGGDAGLILADDDGRVGSAFNTDLMQTATATE